MRIRSRGRRAAPRVPALALAACVLAAAASAASPRARAAPAPAPVSGPPGPAGAAVAIDAVGAVGAVTIAGGDTLPTRTRLPEDFPLENLLGGPWRLDMELGLARDGPDLLLVDGAGNAERFVPRAALADGRFLHVSERDESARVEGAGSHHVVHAADGSSIEFVAGRPVRAVAADGTVARWRRESGRLLHHDDGRGRQLDFEYEDERLVRLRSDGRALDLAPPDDDPALRPEDRQERSWFGECPADTLCDTENSPPSDQFLQGPGIPGAIRRDLRPGSCRSYFVELAGARRGRAIEAGLGQLEGTGLGLPTARGFPVVDFVGRTELVVARSRDLASPTYGTDYPGALFHRLMRDGRDIDRLLLTPLREEGHVAVSAPAGETGIRRIESTPARDVTLELIVRHGMASADQVRQMERARAELASRYGVILRVVEIP